MRRYCSILFLMLLTAACYRPAPEPEFNMAEVIPEDTMVVLMTEMQLIDGAMNLRAKEGKPMADYASAYSQQVLDKHGISRESFTESIRYYSYYIEKMNAIYEQVIIKLGTIESEVNKKE